jgi:SAM-dependent methyltransferase
MLDHALRCYASPERHAAISDIIRRRSSHAADVRDVALAGLNLRRAHRVLDLGCGFGFMTARVLPRLAKDALVLGVDTWEENRKPFVDAVTRAHRRAEFRAMRIGADLPWADKSFDLVLASYSLYFFPAVLGEIARLLHPQGLFLSITHSEDSFHALYAVAGVAPGRTPLLALLRSFSAENGAAQLRRHFGRVEQIEYRNDLRFERTQFEDILRYVHCKIPLLLPHREPADEVPADVRSRLQRLMAEAPFFVIEKDDAIFRCRGPLADRVAAGGPPEMAGRDSVIAVRLRASQRRSSDLRDRSSP